MKNNRCDICGASPVVRQAEYSRIDLCEDCYCEITGEPFNMPLTGWLILCAFTAVLALIAWHLVTLIK